MYKGQRWITDQECNLCTRRTYRSQILQKERELVCGNAQDKDTERVLVEWV